MTDVRHLDGKLCVLVECHLAQGLLAFLFRVEVLLWGLVDAWFL